MKLDPRTPMDNDDTLLDNTPLLHLEPKHAFLVHPDRTLQNRQGTILGCVTQTPHTLVVGQKYTIRSQNYPNVYPQYHSCDWKFSASGADSISVTCNPFNVYKVDHSCTASYLAFSGGNLNKKYCSNLSIFTAISYANYMTVAFRTNDKQATGFSCDVVAKKGSVVTVAPPVATTTTKPTVTGCRCGKVNRGRIAGGASAGLHEYPWQVYLIDLNCHPTEPCCGGSIISNQWILTAAHCVENTNPSLYFVVVGDHNWNTASETSYTKKIAVSQVIIKDGYTNRTYENDVALLKLKTAITFAADNKIAPVCLPPTGSLYENVQATVTGWGYTVEATPQPPAPYILQEVTIGTMSNAVCKKLNSVDYLSDNMICAGGLTAGGRDFCAGDSGGPLITTGNTAKSYMIQIGVVSRSLCGEPSRPGIYMRVTKYLDWIKKTTGGLTTCPPA